MNCLHLRSRIVLIRVGVILLLGASLSGCQGISPDGLPSMEMTPEDTMQALEEIEAPSTMEPAAMHGENEHGAAPMVLSETRTPTEEITSTMSSAPSMAGHHSHGAHGDSHGVGAPTEMMGKATNTPESTLAPTPAAPDSIAQSNSAAQSESNQNVFIVEIRLFTFQTPELRIPVDATVVWRNLDDIEHTVTSGTPGAPDGRFDSGALTLNQEFRFTFSQPGEYSYFCHRHPHMTGKVIVEAP